MGNCCKKSAQENEKLTFDLEEEKAGIKSPEEQEKQYMEVLRAIEIDNPFLKVNLRLHS